MSGSSTLPRFGTQPGRDNTARVTQMKFDILVYAAVISIIPDAYRHSFKLSLTGNAVIDAIITECFVGDKAEFMLFPDTVDRVVTFGTGLGASGAINVPANKLATVLLIFDGVKYVEQSRAIEA